MRTTEKFTMLFFSIFMTAFVILALASIIDVLVVSGLVMQILLFVLSSSLVITLILLIRNTIKGIWAS